LIKNYSKLESYYISLVSQATAMNVNLSNILLTVITIKYRFFTAVYCERYPTCHSNAKK